MTRPIWQRVYFGEVLWKDKTTKQKVANVAAGIFAFLLLPTPYLFLIVAIAFYAYRYRKVKAGQ